MSGSHNKSKNLDHEFLKEQFWWRSLRSASCCGRLALIAAVFAFTTLPAEAQILDWLTSRNSKSRRNTEISDAQKQGASVSLVEERSADKNISGNNLDSYKFAQSHWTHSRNRLQKACRAISSHYNDAATRDILQKLFVVDTQLFRENIKNAALAVNEVRSANDNVRRGLTSLSRIITAPGQETLEALENTADQVFAANAAQVLLVKKYLTGAELIIRMAQSSYETLELIPSLSQPGLDLFVQMSKQLMRMTQSNSEAFKGLLLNVQTSTEQVASGIENVKKTVRETLRFSDHFAIRQFPLINLPAPSREKIYNQLNSLVNSVRGVENTITIADSQVRNNSQQFTHLVSGFLDKSEESLRYRNPNEVEAPLEQISTYARNQVSGLFLRVKEDVGQMREEMAKAARPVSGNMPPAVKFESNREMATRRAMSAANEKLPLFLLGGRGVSSGQEISEKKPQGLIVPDSMVAQAANPEVESMQGFQPLNAEPARVLYSEKSGGAGGEFDLVQSEVNILSQELGADFFFGNTGENLSKSSLLARGGEDMPDFGMDDEDELSLSETGYDNSESMQVSYGNLESSADPEMELLRFDSLGSPDNADDLMPMLNFHGGVLSFDD